MSTIRILHVLHGLNRGGIETLIMNIYKNIDRQKVQFDFAIVEKEKCEYEDDVYSLGGRIYRLPTISLPTILSFCREFGKLCRNYTIVHSHWNTLSSLILMIARTNDVKYRIAHSHIAKYSSGIKGLVKRILRIFINHFSTHQFACGMDAGVFLFGSDFTLNESYKVIKNGIEVDKFRYNPHIRQLIRSQMNISERTFVVGHVGRIGEQKNQIFAVEIFAEIVQRNPDSLLWFIGTGTDGYVQEVRNKAVELNVDNKITFIGSVPNVNEYLNAFDIFLFPSLYEGLSVALIEAQASGLNCYTSDAIDRNSKVTENVIFNSLSEHPSIWAERILANSNIKRNDTKEDLINAGYDIIDTANWLENFYLSLD